MGFVHIYTGDGKGKTTAAIGLALRAVGAKKRVFIFQFMKAWISHEIEILKSLGVIVDREWDGNFIKTHPSKKQFQMVKNQYERVFNAFEKSFDLIILDEILVAFLYGLLSEEEIIKVIDEKPKNVELILTGRGATEKMIKKADLVTYMKKIKHYFDKGVNAREGIEY
ncbi:cob(I)yrinic acid a,c-diamide adenosyltransferase [Nitrosophilus kaiyonis]|uniref:cob(I)yrinic acid a,c-diamide adenosyltransferase n=1 Tax=Nitrosophilus kaiyonis TaxID=2930200 RepID=UPI0024906486|nr:cob(I)yrinic acid a,c-diamide adenosyltransferase [Nitrosophilus kaiyonis]